MRATRPQWSALPQGWLPTVGSLRGWTAPLDRGVFRVRSGLRLVLGIRVDPRMAGREQGRGSGLVMWGMTARQSAESSSHGSGERPPDTGSDNRSPSKSSQI